jgi:hypothetical protein
MKRTNWKIKALNCFFSAGKVPSEVNLGRI